MLTSWAEETIRIIQQAGFDTGRLAAVIADAGALIAKPSADGSFRPSDAWGSLIAFRWLRPVATCGVLDASLGALALLPSPALPSPILRFQLAEGATAVPAIHLLMRRLRRKGIRLTLHYAAGAYELRALPLRASRSLALRWLASRLGVSLDSTVILASNTSEPDGDRADTMAGITRVLLVGGEPPIPEVIGPSDAAAVAAAFVQRTAFVKEAALADALTVALQSPAPAEDQK